MHTYKCHQIAIKVLNINSFILIYEMDVYQFIKSDIVIHSKHPDNSSIIVIEEDLDRTFY